MTADKKMKVVDRTVAYVRGQLDGEGSGHDWWHTYRVWRAAIRLGQNENADMFVIQLGALLHDIADWKFHDGDEEVGPRVAGEWLRECDVDSEITEHVQRIVRGVSFKGAGVKSEMDTIEGMIVQDADRLDAIGAIGIGRTFTYGGHTSRSMYDPGRSPMAHSSSEAYRDSASPTINHFYEKLLLLKNLMNTETAKAIAQRRHEFMELFLERFFEEWEGQDIPGGTLERGA